MSTTWKDIKLATLQKMFSANGTTIQNDSSISEYLNGMPQACNEALELLSTAGKFLTGEIQIINWNIKPAFGLMKNVRIIGEPFSFVVSGAKSYYFTASDKLTVTMRMEGVEDLVIEVDSPGAYTKYKGLIANEDNKDVTVTVTSTYPANIRNIAFYDVPFENEEDVPDYEEYLRFCMTDIAEDFYQLWPNEIYYEQDDHPQYLAADQYYQEAGKILVIPRNMEGKYTVYYRKYPKKIDFNTEDDYEMPVHPEVATLIPLYMASQLYKDDDNSIATVYRNEFEVGRDALSQQAEISAMREFTSVSGW